MRLTTLFAALLCLCLLALTTAAHASTRIERHRATCSAGNCPAPPRATTSTTTRTTITKTTTRHRRR
jgi:hypothetical protein